MKTICIKTNNTKASSYILESLNKAQLDNTYCSLHKFKIYNNIFIHYTGKNTELFLCTISHLLVFLVFEFYENKILNKILKHEYFYFDCFEKNEILEIIQNNLNVNIDYFTKKEEILFNIFYNFLKSEKVLYLQGFVTFRIKEYIDELEYIVEDGINQYLIERNMEIEDNIA